MMSPAGWLHALAAHCAGLAAALILAALAALHLAWAAGIRTGLDAAVPERRGAPLFKPGPASCIAVAMALALASGLAAARAFALAAPVSPALVRAGLFTAAAVFLLRALGDRRYLGFFKTVNGTRFAKLDTRWYSPLCAALSALLLLTAW